jgi:hypothetical protein
LYSMICEILLEIFTILDQRFTLSGIKIRFLKINMANHKVYNYTTLK